jgi:alpha-methylacyl-CoA racemase
MSARADAPLDGVLVVDLTRLLPGAYATSLLVGLGAEVVKVEEPRGGDGLRAFGPFTPTGESGVFVALCRGKRSITLDLKNATGQAVMRDLLRRAHVLVDSFRPRVLDRLGIGPDVLAELNPSLVHVSMTAYGDGGRAALPAHDLNTQGMAGILGLARGADGSPGMPPLPVVDMATGLQAALAVVSGLRVAEATDGGFRTDVTMLDSAFSLTSIGQGHVIAGTDGPPTPDMLTGGLACYGIYRCGDGLELALGALEPQFFGRVAELVGDPTLAAVQYAAAQDGLRGRLSALFASRPRHEWLDLLEDDQTCVTPVRTASEAVADDDLRTRGVVVEVALADGSTVRAGRPAAWVPVVEPLRAAPGLGADTDAVLRRLGHDPDAVRASGAVGGAT